MRVAVTGASGLIGSALRRSLESDGDTVVPMVRRRPAAGEVAWDPDAGTVDRGGLATVDAVVHLAAEPIRPRPLTPAKRRRLRDSRVRGTRVLAEALAERAEREPAAAPGVFVAASGVNLYGDRGDEVLTEDSGRGPASLMTDIAADWEAAADPARAAGLRVVHVRTGIVLDRGAMVLKVLGTLARWGATAPLGSGRQYWPWISLDDTVGIYRHVLDADGPTGPLNATAPNPVTNAEFTRTLARVLRRPVLPVPVPRLAPAVVLGPALASDLLFTSMRVVPQRALASGYRFRHPHLEAALRAIYGR